MSESSEIQWWGYLHQNGSLQVKRWFGDHGDYTTDCEGNDFVVRVVPPFTAGSREEAIKIIHTKLTEKQKSSTKPRAVPLGLKKAHSGLNRCDDEDHEETSGYYSQHP
jgi:hypothetical protein